MIWLLTNPYVADLLELLIRILGLIVDDGAPI
jgi:hypothetical protein